MRQRYGQQLYGRIMELTEKALARQARLVTPEHRLWFGVLIQIIEDIGYGPADTRRRFFAGEYDWVCGIVRLDPDYTRDIVTKALAYGRRVPRAA